MTYSLRALAVGLGLVLANVNAHADDLYQIYQKALEKDPVLRQADASRKAAMEAIGVSRASLLPQVNLNGSYNNDLESGATDTLGASLRLDQSLYNRANWVSLERSEKVASQADTGYKAELQGLMLRVSNAYFAVLSAQDQLEFVQATKRAIARQLEQTKQRFAVGLTAITDVHEAQAEYDQTVADEIVAINTLENSYEGLREITGMYHRDLNVLNTERFSPVQPAPATSDAWQKMAQEQNLQIIAQQLAVDIANQDIKAAKTGYWPTFSLFASYGKTRAFDAQLTDPTTGNSFTDDVTTDSKAIGLTMSLPIYSGGATSASTRVARASYVEASEQLNEVYRATMRNVINSYNNVKATISAVKAFEQTVISRESSLQATEAGFEVGTRTIVDVLNSTRSLYDAKSRLSTARYNYVIAILQLKQAAGTLNEEDMQLVSNGLTPAK